MSDQPTENPPQDEVKEEKKEEAQEEKKEEAQEEKKEETQEEKKEETQGEKKEGEGEKKEGEGEKKEGEEDKKEGEEDKKEGEEENKEGEEEKKEEILNMEEEIINADEEKLENEEEDKFEDKLYEYNGKQVRPNLLKFDVTNKIKKRAFELGFESLKKYTSEKEMSDYIKERLDDEFQPEWQCVIGKDFSVAFSFEVENFIFFQIEDCYFLFYKL